MQALSADETRRVDHLQIAPGDVVELVQDVVIEPSIAHAADVPGRTVVGEDHPVALQGLGDRPRERRITQKSTDAFRRTRRPIGGREAEDESLASWRAG